MNTMNKEGVPRQRTSRGRGAGGEREGSGGIVSQRSRRERCHV